ncbi:hypothetical protein ACRRTK_014865 [Alexandromys fortis]
MVLRADGGVGEGCPQKLVPANLLRFLLLALIPCICALIVLLAVLLSFVDFCAVRKLETVERVGALLLRLRLAFPQSHSRLKSVLPASRGSLLCPASHLDSFGKMKLLTC